MSKSKGADDGGQVDGELTVGSIVGVKKISDFTTSRMDHSVRKRVELHCHTKMSDMDGVSEVKDIVKRRISGDIRRSQSRITRRTVISGCKPSVG